MRLEPSRVEDALAGLGKGAYAYTTPLSAIKRERVRWLWPDRVPLGMLTLLIGDPGLGKSLLTLYLAAIVSKAGGDVLVLSAEDHAGATIRPRAEATGADLDRIHVVRALRDDVEDGLVLPDDAGALDSLAIDLNARLVIVDPLNAHLADGVNSWRDQSVRRALAPLYRLAERRRCAVISVAHLNKAQGANPLYRAGGSIGIPAAVRSALLLARDPDDPDGELGFKRVLAHVKCNVGKQAESLACQVVPDDALDTARIIVTGTSTTTAADLLDAPTVDERTERDEAREYLGTELAGGPRPAKELYRDAPCSPRTLRKAKKDLEIESVKDGFTGSWIWRLTKRATTKEAPPISAALPPSQEPHDQAVPKEAATPRRQGGTYTDDDAPLASSEEEENAARLVGVDVHDDEGGSTC